MNKSHRARTTARASGICPITDDETNEHVYLRTTITSHGMHMLNDWQRDSEYCRKVRQTERRKEIAHFITICGFTLSFFWLVVLGLASVYRVEELYSGAFLTFNLSLLLSLTSLSWYLLSTGRRGRIMYS